MWFLMDDLTLCVFFKVMPADENSDMTVNMVLWVADTQLSTTEVQHKMTFGFVYEKKIQCWYSFTSVWCVLRFEPPWTEMSHWFNTIKPSGVIDMYIYILITWVNLCQQGVDVDLTITQMAVVNIRLLSSLSDFTDASAVYRKQILAHTYHMHTMLVITYTTLVFISKHIATPVLFAKIMQRWIP